MLLGSDENEQMTKPSTDVNLNLLDATGTSGIPGTHDDDVTVTSSSPLLADTAGELPATVDGLDESGTLVDFDGGSLTTMAGTVDDVPLQTEAFDNTTTSVCHS